MVKIREEIEQWQASLLTMKETVDRLETELAAEKQNPSRATEQVTSLAQQLAEQKAELEALKAQQPPSPAPSGEGESPSPETQPEISSAPKTRAQKVGWV